MKLRWVILAALFWPALAFAHSGSGSPYVLINGQYAPANSVASLYLDLPQDIAPEVCEAGKSVDFAVDTTILTAEGFRWVWEGGEVSEGVSAKHSFSNGTHIVRLQAQAVAGGNYSEIDTIAVNIAPNSGYKIIQPKFSATQVGRSGNSYTVQFVAQAMGAIDYEWKFGDGGSARGQSVSHTYEGKEWTFYPKLRVTDAYGVYVDVAGELIASDQGVSAQNIQGQDVIIASAGKKPTSTPVVLAALGVGVVVIGLVLWQARRRASLS